MNRMTISASSSSASFRLPQEAPASARMALRLLQRLQVGSLDVQFPDGSTARFGHAPESGVPAPRASLHLHNWRVCAAAMKSGDIGFAEGYIHGDWSTSDLTALLKLFIANRDQIEKAIYGHWLGRLVYRVRHLLNHNSKANSRKNIQAHYDLGNDFYRLWLDPTMSYSSAWFEGDHSRDMAQAQRAKVKRALVEAGVTADKPGQRVLEIGCGWGGLAEIAAAEHAAHVTGVTLSTEQLQWAQARLAKAGLARQADLRLQDYRDIQDQPFDAIVSIEMFEAVGREYWAGYFSTLKRCLKPGGRACLQTITIHDDLFDRYVKSTDFIQQYIFPGGLLPSDKAFRAEAAKAGLEVVNAMAFGPDYAETLRRWRADFHRHIQQVQGLGFDERFQRIWEFYLGYCEAAFDMGNTNVVQYTLRKPA
ncbi:MAG TPA: cyclopropane-fatty-acyl-phospholipid synthase family protein [Aquabacterium sp.]|uniref:cyclopropane-fatty-acyl-phospholipid synthase family protein n=1 Tax=Aquabacterium sp. TaxID=1872578 RepID=UPI002E301565|nr:cyclopropane-fatty-acyl-phospholipid synthase family protein [Aquabacterium sp.]HEX5355849.1 cyclopropane-fatty-acyl-phospholipid synthase family protein [Aquabacterium sp.]